MPLYGLHPGSSRPAMAVAEAECPGVLTREQAEMQYQNLLTQLNPHFLFNSFSTLESLIYRDPPRAARFLNLLTKVYRYVLHSREQALVSLEEEVKFMQGYAELMETRFGVGLSIQLAVPESQYACRVVPAVLQVLVENAVRHNVIDGARPLRVGVSVKNQCLVVRNTFQPKPVVESARRNGLNNLRNVYRHLSSRPLVVRASGPFFTVKVPLLEPLPTPHFTAMNALIVEDESLIAEQLQRLLGEVAPHLEVLGILPSIKATRRWLVQHGEPDVLFMDIQLSDGISFELFKHVELRCPVVFTTAYDEYALQAFRNNGIAYLLKPVDEDDLLAALEKLKNLRGPALLPMDLIQDLMARVGVPSRTYKETFLVNFRQAAVPIRTADIAGFVLDQLIYLIRFDGQRFVTEYDSLDEVEALVDPDQFYRINRRQLIHLNAVGSFKSEPSGKLYLNLSVPTFGEADVSREKAPYFKRWLDR